MTNKINNVKIGIVYHKQFMTDEILGPEYLRIHVGRKLYNGQSNFLLNLLGDDTGDNISELNSQLNELTALYWFGKHYAEIGNPQYFGIMHYRRRFQINFDTLNPNSIIVNTVYWPITVRQQLHQTRHHILNDLIAKYLSIVPADTQLLNTFFNERYLYRCNMFIMHKCLFFKYLNFLDICVKCCQQIINSNIHLQNRQLGFAMERFTSFFIYKQLKQNLTLNAINTRIIEYK